MAFQVFETTIFNRNLGTAGEMLFVPADVLDEVLGRPWSTDAELAPKELELLGIDVGLRVPDEDGLADVLYAALQGRIYSFGADSFETWRARRRDDHSERASFAHELAFGERVPVTSSPLHTDSLARLFTRGSAWTAGGLSGMANDPLHALGLVVATEAGIVVVSIMGAVRASAVIAVKYHLRHIFGVPPDWLPPEDRL
jgi:hypothetical protein